MKEPTTCQPQTKKPPTNNTIKNNKKDKSTPAHAVYTRWNGRDGEGGDEGGEGEVEQVGADVTEKLEAELCYPQRILCYEIGSNNDMIQRTCKYTKIKNHAANILYMKIY